MDEFEEAIPLPELPDQSAASLITALQKLDRDWHTQLPEDAQIVIYVPLVSGGMVELGYVQDLGYNVLYIQGRDGAGEQYVLIAHQATIQFFCQVKKITPEHPRRAIGFGPHPPNLTAKE